MIWCLSALFLFAFSAHSNSKKNDKNTIACRCLKKKRKADAELTTFEIMLIDDSNVFLKIAKRKLSALGCNVIVANNSTLAMSILHKNSETIKLILLDIIMPEVDGIQVIFECALHDIV